MESIDKLEQRLVLRNYSQKTISTYLANIKKVARDINKSPSEITEEDLKTYILNNKSRTLSTSTQMMIINSFKALYREIYHKKFDHDILPRPRISQRQPDILSYEEIQIIIDNITNLKHRTIICLMYSCGLRISEALNLRVKDIDSKNNKINIRDAKNMVDRVVMLDPSLLHLLREYTYAYNIHDYIFTGQAGGKYSPVSVRAILKKAISKTDIDKHITTHSLRHSCLTQLIKNGVDLRTVQKIAGHKNINSTANYIKIIDSDILNTDSPIKMIKI